MSLETTSCSAVIKKHLLLHTSFQKQHENEMDALRSEMSILKENYEKFFKENNIREELMQRNAEIGELKQKLIEFSQR